MIKEILKLENFGIFHNFTWNAELPNFKKFNLIYGWNRSGKTTISRVFASCEKRCAYDKDKFPQYPAVLDDSGLLKNEGKFEIITDDNIKLNNANVAENSSLVKVFNQDFIDTNISFDPSDSCNAIVYVSEQDIEVKSKLKSLKEKIQLLSDKYQGLKSIKESTQKIEDNFRISLAQTITQLLTDKTKRDKYYSYNKSSVKEKIDEIGIDMFTDKILFDDERKKYESISKSVAEQEQLNFSSLSLVDFNLLYTRTKYLLDKRVVSELLGRLKDPQDIDGGLDEELNTWVKQGFNLHKTRNHFKQCLFCENNLNNDFFDLLAKHFSKDYEDLQISIECLIEDLKKETLNNIPEKNLDLYSDLRNDYEIEAKKYNEIVKRQNTWLYGSKTCLEQKYRNPFDLDISEMVDIPEGYVNLLNKSIEVLNRIITKHNLRVRNHAAEVMDARERLELHSIALALSEQDYKKMEADLEVASKNEVEALAAITKNDSEIKELETQNSNIGTAIININKHLEEFFGRKEIELVLDGDGTGYAIRRNGKPANNLSEGEKNAIAFSYFVVKVGEGDLDKTKAIIFIDDPISSFDSNFIYHCFSIINTHFKEVGQLFISTHNFHFFNLIKEWYIGKNDSIKKDNKKLISEDKPEKPIPCEFFMVENYTESDIRRARIAPLDKTLLNYKSEYHFLFAKLNEFSEKRDTQYEDFYTIGNMARRFFDIFADFKIPITGDQRSKMDTLVRNINNPHEKISAVDVGKAYKLVNEFSHNSDPTSTIEHKDKTESKEAVRILLRIVKESDLDHFDMLEKELAKNRS